MGGEFRPVRGAQGSGRGGLWRWAGLGAAMAAAPRWRERLFALYFLSHVPVTLLIDLQPLLPAGVCPPAVSTRGRGAGLCGQRGGRCGWRSPGRILQNRVCGVARGGQTLRCIS